MVGKALQKLSDLVATSCQILGSLPLPMCVCTRSTSRLYLEIMEAIVPSSRDSYQIPKEEEGPPTFVLEKPVVDDENPPEPTPGLIRIPTFCGVGELA